jgi:hypothetical protein
MPGFPVEIIKPSHTYDEGYVIQWWKASIPLNSLAGLLRHRAGRGGSRCARGRCRDQFRRLG